MVAFTLFKSASLLALVSSLVSAAPLDTCDYFRVTSPNTYFTTTAGECQQVSYDYSGPAPAPLVSIDLYEYSTDKFISSLVQNVTGTGPASPWFNINLNGYNTTADYYFLVSYGPGCDAIKTQNFHVLYNPNSPPAVCPQQ
ncbi:uncharacterized protein B0P05DRAFT_531976 [Gilbertella persicaria]|uniref:uncharacterized protein n=1 Tax=Gilbertella persicaria TaxID=101096 RepID=UPI00221F2A41|nr:uncharacterized protein B0P05DRAFT_531976 [Gilbertella persicaria]KAI8087704.1 hypothetical protein B0P05DRAFT_531976 [Gilbertella persicaria]